MPACSRLHARLYFRFSVIGALALGSLGRLGPACALGGRAVLAVVLLRRWLRCLRGLPSRSCRGAPGGKPLEATIQGLHRRFLELYASKGGASQSSGAALPPPHPEEAVLALQQRLRLRDGQEIAYWDVGPRDAAGGAVLLCNGLGARAAGWAPLLDALHGESAAWAQRRLVIPEYRGQFASTPLVGDGVSVERSAADLAEVAAALGLQTCTLLCWSTGVQVGLQLALDKPDLVGAMVLIQGTTGQALNCILQPLCTVPGMPSFLGAFLKNVPKVMVRTGFRKAFSDLLVRRTWLFERFGGSFLWLFGTDLMPPIVVRYGQDMMHTDSHFLNYCGYAQALGRHVLAPRLSEIRAPAFVVTGTPDFVTPARCSYDLAVKLGSEDKALFDDPGGSHYYIFEEPHKLAKRVAAFLDRVAPAGPPR